MTCPYCEIGKSERQVIETWDLFHVNGVDLTKQQTRIMAELLSKQGVHRIESLISAVWYDNPNGEPDYADSIIKVHLSKIRKKLSASNMALKIRPVWGIGYTADKKPGKDLKSVAISLTLTLLCVYPLSGLIS